MTFVLHGKVDLWAAGDSARSIQLYRRRRSRCRVFAYAVLCVADP